jgi:hypothetical protein
MTVVLQFPVNRVVQHARNDVFLTGEVVIFPGVRVERRNFDPAKTAAPSRKHRASQAAIDEDMA